MLYERTLANRIRGQEWVEGTSKGEKWGERRRSGREESERERKRERQRISDTSGVHERLMKTCRWSMFSESFGCDTWVNVTTHRRNVQSFRELNYQLSPRSLISIAEVRLGRSLPARSPSSLSPVSRRERQATSRLNRRSTAICVHSRAWDKIRR